jgi:deoxyribose-phosphate aldolase
MSSHDLDDLIDKITQRVTDQLNERLGKLDRAIEESERVISSGLTVIKKGGRSSGRYSQEKEEKQTYDRSLAAMIDHTLLAPDASKEQLRKLCSEAKEYNFATCCVNSANIPYVAELLKGSSVKPIAVVGFPLGAGTSESKVFEAQEAIKVGAEEIDMVINIGALKSKDYETVFNDIKKVVEGSAPKKVKVILEISNLNNDEIVAACILSKTAKAAFVKTSTGFGKGGATVEAVKLMKEVVGNDMEVKASGGIRTRSDADAMIKAGATRIGASASIAIVTGQNPGAGKY